MELFPNGAIPTHITTLIGGQKVPHTNFAQTVGDINQLLEESPWLLGRSPNRRPEIGESLTGRLAGQSPLL